MNVFALVRPEEVEVDLDNFVLSNRTRIFFEKLVGLLNCKLAADNKYEEIKSESGVLQKEEYENFGKNPKQEGPDFMTVEKVMSDAKQKKDSFEDLLKSVVRELGMNPDDVIVVDGKTIGSYKVLTLVPLKSEKRIRAKTKEKYGGNAKRICDVGRASIVCYTEERIARVIDALKGKSIRMKNRFANPYYTGTRDALMNIKVDGHVFEVQIHLADLLAVNYESHGHDFYEYFREYFVDTSGSYEKRAELFRRLGETVLTGDVTTAVQKILEGEDRDKLEALTKITDRNVFAAPNLDLLAQKRLLSLLLQEGENKKALLDRLHYIAMVYQNQGKHQKALEWNQRALEGREAALGKEHPSTLATVNNMANVYQKQGKHQKALEWYQRVLEGKEAALGKYNRSTSDTAYNMGILFQQQGNKEKAIEYFELAKKGYEETLGVQNSETVDAAGRLLLYGIAACVKEVERERGCHRQSSKRKRV